MNLFVSTIYRQNRNAAGDVLIFLRVKLDVLHALSTNEMKLFVRDVLHIAREFGFVKH